MRRWVSAPQLSAGLRTDYTVSKPSYTPKPREAVGQPPAAELILDEARPPVTVGETGGLGPEGLKAIAHDGVGH
jgi:hypothetical protein